MTLEDPSGTFRRKYQDKTRRSIFELSLFSVLYVLYVRANIAEGNYDVERFILVGIGAVIYATGLLIRFKDIHAWWGFGFRGLGTGCVLMLWVILVSILPAGLATLMWSAGGGMPRLTAPAPVYLAWCLIQDFVFFSFCSRHLETLLPRLLVPPIVAALFGVSHLPLEDFTWITAGAGFTWSCVFVATHNVYPILIGHWVLGIVILTM